MIQRINRALRKDNEVLKSPRGGRARFSLGQFFILDVRRNAVVREDVDIDALGRQLGALKPFEHLEGSDG